MKKTTLIILTLLITLPSLASAANGTTTPVIISGNDKYTLLEALPCVDTTSGCTQGKTQTEISLNDYVGYVYKFAIALATLLAIIVIIWGGFEYMLSDSVTSKSSAKSKFTNAGTGLLMVMASYLILRTIDPRLVAIETRLPAIDIKIPDVLQFQSDLSVNLAKFGAEAQENIKSLQTQNKSKEARLAEIDKIMEENNINPTLTIDQVQALGVEYETLKGQIAQNNVGINANIAKGSGSIQYQTAINIINNKNPTEDDLANLKNYYDPNATHVPNIKDPVTGKLPINTPNTIQNQYNDKINKVAASDPAAAQILANQRDFYIGQIESQAAVEAKIKTQNQPVYSQGGQYGPPQIISRIDNTSYLQSKLSGFENQLEPQNILYVTTRTGISSDEYTAIVKARINEINTALGKN